MNTALSPQQLCIDLVERSTCSVKVAAVLADKHGIFAWGWNGMGHNGLGHHAEAHALSRANRRRLANATMYVAAVRKRNHKTVTAKPCQECHRLMIHDGVHQVVWRNADGDWITESLV